MPIDTARIDAVKVGDFRFKPLKGGFLLTNDFGEHCFLKDEEFKKFLYGKTEKIATDKSSELISKGFMRNQLDFSRLAKKYSSRTSFLSQGPSLHIVVLTRRCNHRCSYCQTSSRGINDKKYDMDKRVASKVIAAIFESRSQDIVIEFQGGEPTLNFESLKYIVEEARERNKAAQKKLLFSVVSNMGCMDEDKLDFLLKNNVGICTSLDGPRQVHNKYRDFPGSDSHKNTVKWVRVIQDKIASGAYPGYFNHLNALITVTNFSLKYPLEIVDEYLNLGFKGIDLRPVQPFGTGDIKKWEEVSFSAEQFMNFYKRAFNYILKLNKQGEFFFERRALIFVFKILSDNDPNFLDLRSPCGAVTGQLAYDTNGDVYTCDEARMFASASQPDYSFRLGSLLKETYGELMKKEITRIVCLASCLDNLPRCSNCVYKPFCGICPLYNYKVQDDLFMRYQNQRCRINELTLDFLFDKLKDKPSRKILEGWLKRLYAKEGEA